MALEVWKQISAQVRYLIRNLPIQLLESNVLAVRTNGNVEDVELILVGYNLQANFILTEAVDDQDFILRRTFMKKYDILNNLLNWKLTILDPYMEDLEESIFQVCREPPIDVLVVDHEMFKTEDISLIKLQVRCEKCLKNRLVLLTQKRELLIEHLFLGDSREHFCRRSITNQNSENKLCLRKNLVIASATIVLAENLIQVTLNNQVVKTDQKDV